MTKFNFGVTLLAKMITDYMTSFKKKHISVRYSLQILW